MTKTNQTSRKAKATEAKDTTTTPAVLPETAAASPTTIVTAKAPTKADKVITMLRAKTGATIAEIMAETNWQAHSVRGFLSGTVKKKLGLALERAADEVGVQRYRIVEPACEPRRSERRRNRNRDAAGSANVAMTA
ncbi:DUF3489 domain-containing protein [Shinella zoogloeoides]|uniref:DUF3489 domain-containing protein n=1 Tax=Shinella zoogloeoides TaxID=352475 RepID=UPI00273D983D|nr:DUF3489 domain-containing protein [Shinella zoogloeoides]WLR91331.1 DUF3489 domain-containing protein [Shinella zoogloeoides]